MSDAGNERPVVSPYLLRRKRSLQEVMAQQKRPVAVAVTRAAPEPPAAINTDQPYRPAAHTSN